MNQKQVKQASILDEASEEKQHTLWIQNKVAMARASSQPLVPHEDVMKKANALIAEKAKKHAVG
jgi:hypothetical protein